MRLFHLTYDAAKDKYSNAMEDVIEVLCTKCHVQEIGHPVESTFVFRMESADYDVEQIMEELKKSFPEDFWFVISRAAYTKKRDTDGMLEHFTARPCKEHTDTFPAVLQKLKDAKKLSTDVRNLSM
jgi:hypothetical protein